LSEIDLTRRESFRHWSPVTIRFSDQDSLAHVNNVALAQYFEVGRTAYVYDIIRAAGCEGRIEFILARLVIDFRRELHYPGAIEVGSRLMQLGRKSLTTGYGIFRGEDCIATSEAVNVFYDMETRRSTEPPADVRAVLERDLAEPGLDNRRVG
jgi:acyl-CoA thioester hydrolase